ncbi:MAG TPA: tagaturonate reductase [Flavisolibacter sp.]|jgi:tagaturonate reductase|nr:tagaturonate reductase [Flavisolibacter sp.]
MILSRYTLRNINPEAIAIPEETLFDLPEKVLQFGTGVLLRGLPDYFIDKANKQGIFNGRVVVVKSTAQGDTTAFDKQDGLYTICVRGLQAGEKVEENIINSSISRVVTATEQWNEILECAHNLSMQIIISNTTEVGIQLVHEDIRQHPPKSFPGKLLAFLLERFKAFGGSEHSGMVIVPTELIPENGTKLQAIVLELAHLNSLEEDFIEWLDCCNHFCNSLVDRIVPGKPDKATLTELEQTLGYADGNLTMSEVYRLWAIEGDEYIKSVLTFAQADEGVVIAPDIDIYRELKMRMLNGTHTLSCGLAFLAGFETVKEAMDDDTVSGFIAGVMQNEIAPNIPYTVDLATAHDFGEKVLDRFRNPHIRHQWISITMNYSSKLKMRCIPVLLNHYQKSDAVPEAFALGFAAYLYFMKAVTVRDGKYYGDVNGTSYFIQDDMAEVFYNRWATLAPEAVAKETLSDSNYWGADLQSLPGFAEAVAAKLNLIISGGVKEAVEATETNKIKAA